MQNLYRVNTGVDLQKLLDENREKITILFYSDDRVPGCKSNKPLFIKASKTFTDCMFIFLNLREYDDQDAGFMEGLSGALPKYVCYYDLSQIATVNGPNFEAFVDTLNHLLVKLQGIRQAQTQQLVGNEDDTASDDQLGEAQVDSEPRPIPNTVTEDELEELKKMHIVQKKKMVMEIAQLNHMKIQQQKMMLTQIQQLERFKGMREKQLMEAE